MCVALKWYLCAFFRALSELPFDHLFRRFIQHRFVLCFCWSQFLLFKYKKNEKMKNQNKIKKGNASAQEMSINSCSGNYARYPGALDGIDGLGGLNSSNPDGEISSTEGNESQSVKVAPYCFCLCVFCTYNAYTYTHTSIHSFM